MVGAFPSCMSSYSRIGITAKSGLDFKDEALLKIRQVLESLGASVFVDPTRLQSDELPVYNSLDDIDLLVVIGGDGTVLRAVRELENFQTPILSINRGTVGFLAEIEYNELEEILPKVLNGDGVIEERSILRIAVERLGAEVHEGFALNEAVIAQGTIARLVDLYTTVNGEELTTFHADGLIVSTPTGSTAYSLAAGGPIVHPSLAATILTPINPHSFSQKPIALPSDYKIDVQVQTKPNKFQDAEVVLTLDGQVYIPLQHQDIVKICGCADTVKFLRRKQDTFFGTIRQKLKWGERLES